MTARAWPYVLVDVFSSRPLEGNQLAVFTDARGLSDAEMQALARETNLSETTFILPRPAAVEAQNGVRVRIFTVLEELPFAGHPTLGTAAVLRGESRAREVRLELGVGTIPVTFEDERGSFGEMHQRDPEFGAVHEREAVARAVGIAPDEIADDVPIQTVSTGVAFTMVMLRRLETVRQLQLDFRRVSEYLERSGGKFLYFVCRETVDPAARLHARMLFYNGEDPATGSAAGCCAAWGVAHGVFESRQRALIEQGLECRRPSRILVRAERDGDRIINVRVGGEVAPIGRGTMCI